MFFLIDDLDTLTLWKIILNMVTELPRRKKLPNVNTIEDVVHLISKYCISNHLWYDFVPYFIIVRNYVKTLMNVLVF